MVRVVFVLSLVMLLAIHAGPVWGAGRDEPVVLETATGSLHGSLRLPSSDIPCPVVLLLAGSGPVDRDGNVVGAPGKNNLLLQLADALAERGIASLRCDKRGVAASAAAAPPITEMRFPFLVEDAVGWCRLLQEDGRFTALVVAGHSQGAQVGAEAAWQTGAEGLALLAGAGRPVLELMEEQLAKQLPPPMMAEASAVLDSLVLGLPVAAPPPALMSLFGPGVQPYLMSWQQHDPLKPVRAFGGPLTILQGTTDIQISQDDALALAAAQPRARLVTLEGANHIFKAVAGDALLAHTLSMADSTKAMVPGLVDALSDLVERAEQYGEAREAALERVMERNPTRAPGPWPGKHLNVGARVGYWAERFLEQAPSAYRFGLAEDGYVSQGMLVLDEAMDCVSFVYRCTELARAADDREALLWALRTRFNGADFAQVVGPDGRVDYHSPRHLDFSVDMVRSGLWGRDITSELTGVQWDEEQALRPAPHAPHLQVAAGSFQFVPSGSLDTAELAEGDVVWLVLDPEHEKGGALRREYGLVIGHLGVIVRQADQVLLVHAAASPLPGWYDKSGVVSVPLAEYLQRVDRFAGIMVTRLP